MSNCGPSACVVLTVEIEIPGDVEDEEQDAIVDDLTNEANLDQLVSAIRRWARFFAGVPCHISLDVE